MRKFNDELRKVYEMATNKQKQKDYNDEMARKTLKYQKRMGFEVNPKPGNEFWNVEADAFKHSFGSADMVFDMGQWGSLIGGIVHELQTENNPYGEWNMDSWNNHQGRIIADEIQREYGGSFKKFPKERQDAIIAAKVMQKMKNGDLITKPSDPRKYNGMLEKIFYNMKDFKDKKSQAQSKTISAEDIGRMTTDEFTKNEDIIMELVRKGQIGSERSNPDYSSYNNPKTGNKIIYTREDIEKMSTAEYSKNEKEIIAQAGSIGIPYKETLPSKTKTYEKHKVESSKNNSEHGKWVTINGNHVLIKD